MEKYNITGMSCAACSARVENAVSKVDGVEKCSVNLLTNSMTVEGSAAPMQIIEAVEKAGYGAKAESTKESRPQKSENSTIKHRLISSVVILIVLMYVSMGHSMLKFPIPDFFGNNPASVALLQMTLSALVMVINQNFFINGFKGAIKGAPNMDTLVAMGSGMSFLYSLYALFEMTNALAAGNGAKASMLMHDLYFESAAMIVTLITVGKLLEARSKGKTTDAIRKLINLAPKTAYIIKDGKEIEIPVDRLKPEDIFIVKAGQSIPADGIVIEGHGAVDESSLTGESMPAEKKEGDLVSAASVNTTGYLKCRAVKVGGDTLLSQIIKMVSDTAASKAPIAKAADKVAGVFVPVVIVIAVITVITWLAFGQSVGFAIARGVSVLVISCPCALGLATPVAVMVGCGVGAKYGILFKTAAALEEAGRAKTVVLDKTGTITSGTPEVTDIFGDDTDELLQLAYSIEKNSEHPLAGAVVRYAKSKGVHSLKVSDFNVLPGNGVSAVIDESKIIGGSLMFIKSRTQIPENMETKAEELSDSGKTPLFFCKDNKTLGIIAVADKIKEDSTEAIAELKRMGLYVVMLTGDNERTASAIGKAAGVDRIIAGVLPDGKSNAVKELQKDGNVIMVGDGINDAPALMAADTGIAVGAGTDIAIDSADVVLMKSKLSDIPSAIKLSRGALRNIHQNLFWAFFYNVIGIPLAAGVWIPIFGWKLNPMFGAAAMSLSSIFVVTNALRLNFINLGNKKERKKVMKKTIKIEGMMCSHCSGRVQKCLEELSFVASADVRYETGLAEVTLNSDASDDVLKNIIEEQGYKVISIE